MKVLVDENLPPALAKVLHAIAEVDGHSVEHVSTLGKRGIKDRELFAQIAREGFLVHITLDHHHRKQVERDSIAGAGLIVFVLSSSWDDQSLSEKCSRLLRYWNRIVEQARGLKPPAVLRIPWKFTGKGQFEIIRNVSGRRG